MKTYLKDLTPEEIIRRLKAGEVVKNEQSKNIIKYIDDVLCNFCENGTVEYNTNFWICNCSYYFETTDELKLQEGKRYKTRGGYMAFLAEYGEDSYFYGSVKGYCIGFHWRCDGKHDSKSSFDIVAEWSDDDVEKD